jgi:hypothetical protein
MISESVYENYLSALLAGKRLECGQIVQELLDAGTKYIPSLDDLEKSIQTG